MLAALSSSRLRASAASRSARSTAARCSRICASSSAILRSSASRRRASPSACARRLRSSSVSVCSTTPDGLGAGARRGRSPARRRRLRRGLAGGRPLGRRCGAGAGAASAFALPGVRLFTFSTTTALVRPWLKLWRTTPVSLPRGLSVSVLAERRSASFRQSFPSFQPFRSRFLGRFSAVPYRPSRSGNAPGARARARNALLSGPASRAACITFDRPNAKSNCAEVKASSTATAFRVLGVPAQRGGELPHPVGGGIGGVQHRRRRRPAPAPPRPWRSRSRPAPALWAMASASSAARSSNRSVDLHQIGGSANVPLEAARERLARDRGRRARRASP